MAESVWMLQHWRVSNLPNVRKGRESIITIGLFVSETEARNVIESHREAEGFIDYPDGWVIRELPLNMLLDPPMVV